jgi:hypothetical protein
MQLAIVCHQFQQEGTLAADKLREPDEDARQGRLTSFFMESSPCIYQLLLVNLASLL